MADRTVTVELGLDTSNYEAGAARAAAATSKIESAGKTMAERVGGAMKRTGEAAGTMLNVASAGAAALLVSTVKAGAAYNQLQQNSRAALSTLLGGAKAANEQMDKLDTFAKTSPFAKDVFIGAQQQLLAFGMEAEKVIPMLDAFQQGVAASGGNGQMLSDVAFVIAQIQAAGKITATDLMQLGQRGINAAELIGAAMGKTGTEIKEEISKGTLDAGEALDALAQGMQDRFGGATAGLKMQLGGAVDRVKSARRDIGSLLATPLVDPNGGGALVGWTNSVADSLRAAETQIKKFMPQIEGEFSKLDANVSGKLRGVQAVIQSLTYTDISGWLDRISKYAAPIAGTAGALSAMGANSMILQRLGMTGLNPVAVGLMAVAAASPHDPCPAQKARPRCLARWHHHPEEQSARPCAHPGR